jgi:hypothetical protein
MDEKTEVICYRTLIDRPFTPEDKRKEVGLEGFLAELREAGWADKNNRAIKAFTMESKSYAEAGNNYIEWIATLKK